MKTWEYKIIECAFPLDLNKEGNNGWELCATFLDDTKLVFKRQLNNLTTDKE